MSISAQQKMSETGAMATAMRVVQELPRSRASSPLRITQAPTDLDRQDFFDEDDRMRQCFKSAIGKQLGIRNHYTKVSVLIIHWASEFDTDLGCQSEAGELNALFREEFQFESEIVILDTSKRPQLQLNKAITNFVHDNDGPEHSHLMVLYYTGHGYIYKDNANNLIISGTETGDSTKDDDGHSPKASWNLATHVLDDAEADTLVILDCCYAGNIMKTVTQQTRVYEVMTATGKDRPTESPGKASYTAALIETLKELRKQGQPFTTWQIHQLIHKRRDWNTSSLLWNPGFQGPPRHISLWPPEKPEPRRNPSAVQRSSYLDIRVFFQDNSSLTDDQVAVLAKELSKLRRGATKASKLDVCDIQWRGFNPGKEHSRRKTSFKNTAHIVVALNGLGSGKRRHQSDDLATRVRSSKRLRGSPCPEESLGSCAKVRKSSKAPMTPSTDDCGDTPASGHVYLFQKNLKDSPALD